MSNFNPPKTRLYVDCITGQILGKEVFKEIQARTRNVIKDFASIGKHNPGKIRIKPNEKGWEVYKNRQMITQIIITADQVHRREKFFTEQVTNLKNNGSA